MILGHWDVRGAGQPIRNLLHYLGLEYSEIKYPDEKSWFEKAKPDFKGDFANLPYLIDGEKIITESQAILVYLALKANRIDLLGGKSFEKEVHFVQIRSFFMDIRNRFYSIAMDKSIGDISLAIKEKVLPSLRQLSKHLADKPFVCGELMVIDFAIVELLEWIALQDKELLKDMQNLQDLIGRVYSLPGVKEYQNSKEIPKYFLWGSYANGNLKICY